MSADQTAAKQRKKENVLLKEQWPGAHSSRLSPNDDRNRNVSIIDGL